MMEAMLSPAQRKKRQQERTKSTARDQRDEPLLDYRVFSVVPGTINETDRSVEGIIASENPVNEFDWDRYEYVPRVLLMSGADFPKGQMPLLDCHNRYTVACQFGSIRNMRVESDKLPGTLVFSTAAEDAWIKVREGHVTDISVGFQILAQTYIPEKTTQKLGGRNFTGPLNVATSWRAYEGSITPIGADEMCKMRGLDPRSLPPANKEVDFEMNAKLRELCVSRGMPADLDDDKAQEWIVANPDKMAARTEPPPPPKKEKPEGETARDIIEELDARATKREEERDAKRDANRTAHRKGVDELCELIDLPTDTRAALYELPDMPAVHARAKEIKAEWAKRGLPGMGFNSPRVTGEGRDAFRKDVLTSMMGRVFRGNAAEGRGDGSGVSERTRELVLPKDQRGKGAEQFDNFPITELGRRCLIVDGYHDNEVRQLDKFALARALFGNPVDAGLERRDGGALHTTSSFAYLTENTMNKSMRAGNAEAKTTFQYVSNIGEPVPDFKKKAVYTTSAVGNLSIWPDGQKPDLRSFMDYKDSYGVDAYAMGLEYTWQMFVNDDMGVLIKSPFKLGDGCKRSVNAFFWNIVTLNPALADGQALFLAAAAGNRKKANYISSGLAVTVASVSALRTLMRLQVGQNTREGAAGPDILNIEARYLITPATQWGVAAAFVRSISDPSTGVNPGTHNPFGPDGAKRLELFDEPLLDANSTTAWYMAADPALVDGIELSFMQGFEQPRSWSGVDEKTLSRWWAVAQVWGGKAIDHRGWAKQAGA